MSKKKNLSTTASLGACLDFASRVLSSTASVQEVCTKSVLAPMVVEAHRYGQQVMKRLDSGTMSDFRGLVGVLQDKLRGESALARLVVADVTWDFEGLVNDTLEMELKELEGRVAKGSDSVCAVLSTSAPTSRGEQAVIWFPQTNYQHLDKKPQYLLYVCPGKVKVVKNMGDLVKKLLEELPTMRENGATFSVWAVQMGLNRSNQEEEQEFQSSLSELRKSHEPDNNQKIDVDFDKKGDPTLRQQEILLNQPILPMRPVENPDVSMLTRASLSRISEYEINANKHVVENGSLHERELDNESRTELENNENEGDLHRKYETSSTNYEASRGDDSTTDIGLHNPLPTRRVVSASLADVSISAGHGSNENGADSNKTWQSYDGKVLRGSIRPLHPEKSPCLIESNVPDHFGRNKDSRDNTNSPQAGERNDNKEMRSVGRKDEMQHQPAQVVPIAAMNRSTPSMFTFASVSKKSMDDRKCRSADVVQPQASNLSAHHLAEEVNRGIGNANHQTNNAIPPQNYENDEPVRVVEPSECAFSPTVKLDVPPSPKPSYAPVNYKDKLGARIWWELEYTASRLEQEELRERRQQTERQQQKSRDNIDCRLKPTGWSKAKSGTLEPKKTISVLHEDADDGRQTFVCKANTTSPARPTDQQQIGIGGLTYPDSVQASQSTAQSLHSPRQCIKQTSTMVPGKTSSLSDKISSSNSMSQSFSRSKDAIPENQLADSVLVVENPKITEKNVATASQTLSKNGCKQTDCTADSQNQRVATISPLVSNKMDDTHTSASTPESPQPEESPTLDLSIPPIPIKNEQRVVTKNSSDSRSKVEREDGAIQPSIQTIMHETLQNLMPLTVKEQEDLESPPGTPFSVRGRVPIRSRQASSTNLSPDSDEPEQASPRITARRSSSSSSQIKVPADILKPRSSVEASSRISSSDTAELQQVSMPEPTSLPRKVSVGGPSQTSLPGDSTSSLTQTSTTFGAEQVPSVPPPVATFIPIDEAQTSIRRATTAAGTREQRLNELRQKKLQKLQQTRDESLRQQKEKQQQRQAQKSSFLNSVYPKKASNRQLIQNALEYTLLAGGSMEKERTAALQAIAESTCDNFIVLLKSSKELKFRALYENQVDRDVVTRIFSVMPSNSASAPLKLDSCDVISQFFKYSSAKKQFLPVATRSFTVKTDACALVTHLSMKKKTKSSAIAHLL